MSEGAPSIAVMGSGAVGGYFGARLVQAGCPVRFIARGSHLEAIRKHGLRVDTPAESIVLDVEAAESVAGMAPVDYVLFAVKLWDTGSAAEACRPLIGPDTAVLSLQNGVDSAASLISVLGSEHVMGGVAEISAAISEPGRIRKTSPFHRIRFGEFDRRRSERSMRLGRWLEKAGIEADHASDITAAIWSKFIFMTGLSALTALTREPIGRVRSDPDTRALLERTMAEACAVAKAMAVALPGDVLAERMRFIDSVPAQMRASMAIDLSEGRRLELPWLSGAVVRLGAEHGVATPANAFIAAALKLHIDGTIGPTTKP